MDAIIIDCETTDKDPKTCEVIELAWREFKLDAPWEFRGGQRFSHREPMKFGAMAAHHILPEEVAHHPHLDSVGLVEDVRNAPFWIGHNIDFDWECLGRPPVNRICTLAMARTLWPKCDSHTLSALTYFTQGASPETREKLKSAHSADADVGLCEELLRVIIAEKGVTSLEDLYTFSEDARIPRIMTFGKFKDLPIEAVDRGYANWYRRQPDPDAYLLTAFRRCGLI